MDEVSDDIGSEDTLFFIQRDFQPVGRNERDFHPAGECGCDKRCNDDNEGRTIQIDFFSVMLVAFRVALFPRVLSFFFGITTKKRQ